MPTITADQYEALPNYFHQVAGHSKRNIKLYHCRTNQYDEDSNSYDNSSRIYSSSMGSSIDGQRLLKPVLKHSHFSREVQFYESIFSDECDNSAAAGLRPFLPLFYGCLTVVNTSIVTNTRTGMSAINDTAEELFNCLVLEDLAFGMYNCSVIDIKMGTQTHEPTASKEKVIEEQRKYKYQQEIGFRITGMKVDNTLKTYTDNYCHNCNIDSSCCNCIIRKGKSFGRSLTPELVTMGLALFFYDGKTIRIAIVKDIIMKLKELQVVQEKQTQYHFYSSSILLIYGKCSSYNAADEPSVIAADSNDGVIDSNFYGSRVSMVDFPHVCIQGDSNSRHSCSNSDIGRKCSINSTMVESIDRGYVYGLQKLIDNLEVLVSMYDRRDSSKTDSTSDKKEWDKFLKNVAQLAETI